MLEFKQQKDDNITVLSLTGQLDALTAGTIKPVIDEIVASPRMFVVLNLNDLTLIDSSGVGAIVSMFKRSRAQGGDTSIAGLNNQPKEVFKLLRLDKAINIFESVEEAIEKFKTAKPSRSSRPPVN